MTEVRMKFKRIHGLATEMRADSLRVLDMIQRSGYAARDKNLCRAVDEINVKANSLLDEVGSLNDPEPEPDNPLFIEVEA